MPAAAGYKNPQDRHHAGAASPMPDFKALIFIFRVLNVCKSLDGKMC
jgi:hypothetical protein